jgi:predicted aspartyl protease
MTVSVKTREFSSPITRDALDLSRLSATINGHRVDAILDTGATHSVVSVSTAKRLGLRMVRFEGGVSADGQQISTRFAVADTLLFAGREFRNVPFFVLTDEAVNVPLDQGVAGKLEPMIGLSVLRKLGRFEITQRNGKERFQVGGSSTTTGTPAKLLLPEGAPAVLVHVEPEATELRLSLDTGANRSALAPAAVAGLTALAERAAKGRVGGANAAGSWIDDTGTLIPQLTLRVGEAAIALSKVPVGPGPENFDGTLGQDVFRSGGAT